MSSVSFLSHIHTAILPLRVAQFAPCFSVAILLQISTVLLSEVYYYIFLLRHYLCEIVAGMLVAFRLIYVVCNVWLLCFVAVKIFVIIVSCDR